MITKKTKILLFLSLGHFCVLLGFLGIFLPLLPTTPFVLLATFFYSKSSKKFHTWLIEHRIFGKLILDWEKHGVIKPRIKLISCLSIILFFSYTIIFVNVHNWIKIIVAISGIAIMGFILTRPSNIKD